MYLCLLKHVPTPITNKENIFYNNKCFTDKVRDVVFTPNKDSTYDPNDFNYAFFQICWRIIGKDMRRAVNAFLRKKFSLSQSHITI